MAPVVQSLGALADTQSQYMAANSYGSMRLYESRYYSYAQLYELQPNVRVCVEFLARNIAQLGLHVFRRVSDTDRVRLRDHPLAQIIENPLPAWAKVTRYRMINNLMSDLGIYFNAYLWKVRGPDGRMGLLRIPPAYVEVYGDLFARRYEISLIGRPPMVVGPDEIIHIWGYNAQSAVKGLSPLETLRRVLAEEAAAGDYREHFWQNSARMGGIIERPIEVAEWSTPARERFKQEFEALYSGAASSGKTAILEEGMTWKEATFNAQESEYLAGRKLTREECARAYHIPLPMVGILDHSTFSNIKEQHKHLYQDSLGPWLAMIEQDIQLQLLPDFGDVDGVYVEFNIQEKLQGSFDEQVQGLQSAVGRPWMTPDEARALMNMPSMGGDAEELATPLNVLIGGQASPRDSAPDGKSCCGDGTSPPGPLSTRGEGGTIKGEGGTIDPTLPELRVRYREKWTRVLVRHFERQRSTILSKSASPPGQPHPRPLSSGGEGGKAIDPEVLWDADRWNRELFEDHFRLNVATALEWARYVAKEMGLGELDEARLLHWLMENSRIAAENINQGTLDALRASFERLEPAQDWREPAKEVFEKAISWRAPMLALWATTAAAAFGAHSGAAQAGLRTKTWKVNSGNPRAAHARLNGETVPIGQRFSNGMMWPGDPIGGADDNANCECSVTFGV